MTEKTGAVTLKPCACVCMCEHSVWYLFWLSSHQARNCCDAPSNENSEDASRTILHKYPKNVAATFFMAVLENSLVGCDRARCTRTQTNKVDSLASLSPVTNADFTTPRVAQKRVSSS